MRIAQSRNAHSVLRVLPVMAVVVVAAVAAIWSFFVPAHAPVIPALVLFALVAAFSFRRLTPIALSPAAYLASYMAVVAVLGLGFNEVLVGAGGTGGVDVVIEAAVAVRTASFMLVGASVVLASAALVRGSVVGTRASSLFDLGDLGRYSGWFFAFGLVELIALVAFLGMDNLLERPSRFLARGSSFESVISMGAVAAVVVVAIVFFTRSGALKFLSLALLIGYVGYFTSMGTRRLALVPLLLLLAYAISRRGEVKLIAVVLSVIAAIFSLALPLHFRGQSQHGVIPYLQSLSTLDFGSDVFAMSLNNVIAGFKITAITAFERPDIDLSILGISLNPIAGEMAGWYDVSESLRINRYTPYSAFGELLNYGGTLFVLFMVISGVLLGLMQRLNDALLQDEFGRFVAILSLGLVFVFVIQSGQYNLRSVVRYIYFSLGAQAVGMVVMRTRSSLATKRLRVGEGAGQ